MKVEKRDMKKLRILFGMVALAALMFTACNDETDTYVEQLYTNAQLETAIKTCLRTSADSAVNHLCVPDGYSSYNDSVYRIDYASLQSSLFDTLRNHNFGDLGDSLVVYTNRLAESCGGQVLPILKSAIDSLTITNHKNLVEGEPTITHYFELFEYNIIKAAMQSPVSIRMNLFRVNETWTAMLQKYYQYTNIPINFDIQNYIVDKMLDGILQEMAIEEENIRTDPDHRTDTTEPLAE